MSYFQRNKKQIIAISAGAVLVLAALIFWLQSRFFHNVDDIDATVTPLVLTAGDTLYYKDKTDFSAIKKWSFGDGNVSVNDSGYYIYGNPGYYQVSITLNDKYTKTFSVQVTPKQELAIASDTFLTQIEAPKEALVMENVEFRAITTKAKIFRWKFGESGMFDSGEKNPNYAFKKPGVYTVVLETEETAYPITHRITIKPGYAVVDSASAASIDDMYKKIDDDFRYHLQQIADGNNFNEHYNYLLNKYLCNNENAVVKDDKQKSNSFYYYCAGLQFDKNVTIQAVKVGFDDNMNCVTKVDVIQSK